MKNHPTMKFTLLLLAVLLTQFGCLPSESPNQSHNTPSGRVITIIDGDSIIVTNRQGKRHKVRLAGIDAPERGQPYGDKAKRHLASLIGGKRIQLESYKYDQYGRVVAKIMLLDQDINLSMVRAGLAWWYRRYADEQPLFDQYRYDAAETHARDRRVGLWSQRNPMPPWQWRKNRR